MSEVDPYLHAALVLHGAGKPVSKEGLVAVLKAAGAEADEAKAKVLSEAISGANIDELLKNAAVAAAPVAAPAEAKKEAKKEEVSEEKKEEQAAEGLANLFG